MVVFLDYLVLQQQQRHLALRVYENPMHLLLLLLPPLRAHLVRKGPHGLHVKQSKAAELLILVTL